MGYRKKADELARKYKISVKQARYREDGKWYHHLERFPAAFFDANGYIVFKTHEAYLACGDLQLKQDVHVSGDGISSIPGYKRFL